MQQGILLNIVAQQYSE